ncbi:MAG: VOC family protein [Bacteroidales bacterium]|nr:VOC family protein [Bacteroidales bacterium]
MKNDFLISGIQQVGVGTENFRRTWNWIIGMFGADVRILEDDTVAERMLPYTGGKPQKRHACIAVNLQGGGGFEIWQFSERRPVPCPFRPSVGDLGILAAKVKCRDVAAFHREISAKWKDVSPVEALPDGTPCFYVRDLYGNLFQLVERKDIYIEQNLLTGGVIGAVIGVGDMDAAMRFYGRILGFDRVLSDTTGPFSPDAFIPGAQKKCRRVVLGRTVPFTGAYTGLLGQSTLELVQGLEMTPRKMYEGRFWGDPGFIQLCFDVKNMNALKAFCAAEGHPFTVDSCPEGERFDMGEASGRFCYIEDPDGTLIELVETEKIPVVGKLGWYIDMTRRDPQKSLPKFLFRMMGLVSRQKIQDE